MDISWNLAVLLVVFFQPTKDGLRRLKVITIGLLRRQRHEYLISPTRQEGTHCYHADNNVCFRRECLEFLSVRVAAYDRVEAVFLLEDFGFVGIAHENSNVEVLRVLVVDEPPKDRTADITWLHVSKLTKTPV